MVEIRWHGRGGQGAKTAALLFADAALAVGKYVQAFPEYGPERMGAPVQSFNRIDDKPILMHCPVKSPSVVVVLDPTLMASINVTAGLGKEGTLIINTGLDAAEIKKSVKFDGKIFTVDASKISEETIGRKIPNTPMLAALVKVTGMLDFDSMLEDTQKKLAKKFAHRPEVIEGNIQSMKRAAQEVKSA
ncbi:MAG: pyruvate synthase [Candidatus Edwardsbacteria bacterium RIFOXYD12_FULL_50_11]|uniref:Pyruvate synthase n=1 Tax=Candidatus Edwardsbacteria bacterium GWF2_54_11 TaxID=1817851 RepID=A0A1F5R8K9_9BACT|nr:2-oxoacid:acceptor oxidoreductase family protein [Candidatus Edwardsbacteria bacterium]OGF05031.1 MAG: pyruvate synthase [Candidatus Edwardsbacteria bacterium RifOxyC12_full_54_24]OGF08334.1 MAG: pyruvate synthase [Candidatus Edwardsbacteria bacterium RifOxyA12_full_54_48]OGF10381.1 MAG: pyruvate synthase [Candidatus Edwardsbacteria bacterium GWF2_54_11]OGF11632.1 MAG: pyruvate synthase [Candidatus Edwardsbacteria bacterium GWE2_54_12]OGF17716.1 MAG: pyruvate synthase [Candidatus Edwardsbac